MSGKRKNSCAQEDILIAGGYPQCSYGDKSIDCDGYKMRFDEELLVEDHHNGLELFVKLAVSNLSRTLIISFHTDSSPG
jgi:hypothetical protein